MLVWLLCAEILISNQLHQTLVASWLAQMWGGGLTAKRPGGSMPENKARQDELPYKLRSCAHSHCAAISVAYCAAI